MIKYCLRRDEMLTLNISFLMVVVVVVVTLLNVSSRGLRLLPPQA